MIAGDFPDSAIDVRPIDPAAQVTIAGCAAAPTDEAAGGRNEAAAERIE